jgi:uncharacterized OB-fold protein
MSSPDTRVAPSFDSSILDVSPDGVTLLASWCSVCEQWSFPRTHLCPRCAAVTEPRSLPPVGTLYAHAVIRVPVTIHPIPATIVQVDFEGARVGGMLRSGEPKIGSRCRLAPLELEQSDGLVTAYCFEVVGDR